jgi:hypothetical protein
MALYFKEKEASGLKRGSTEAEGFYFGAIPVLEAGNFRTADGELFVTSDGFTFNTKE